MWDSSCGSDEERCRIQDILEDGEQLLRLGCPKADTGAAWRRLEVYHAALLIFPIWIWAFL